MNSFTSGRHRYQWVLLLFGAFTILAVISIAYTFIDIDLLEQEIKGVDSNTDQRQVMDSRQRSIDWYYFWFSYISGISFLVWLYRANSNLQELGTRNPRFSSWGSIGWFLVPVFNLFRPYQIVSEIYTESHPNPTKKLEAQDSNNWKHSLVFWWWSIVLIAFAVRFILAIYTTEANDSMNYTTDYEYLNLLKDIEAHRYALIASRFADIAAFVSTIYLVRSIYKRQKTKHQIVLKEIPV